jgi:long-chain fatty acid transport protein
MVDYKHVWNSSVAALGNTSTTTGTVLFGADNGPGFGLRDLDIYKIAMEWRANQLLTLRAGYSYNTKPFKSTDADLSVMHLGVVQHHITGGAKLAVSQNVDLELSAMYAPKTSLTGPELMNPPSGRRMMTTDAEQFEVTVGAVYRFGEPPRANTFPMK